MARPVILCPVDFSDASQSALRYASVIAEHAGAQLRVVTITDPLLAEAAELAAATDHLPAALKAQLHSFYEETCDAPPGDHVTFEVTTGKPAVEILRLAVERPAVVVVMGTHGLTGLRKLFFGSTTERVLRETTVPVLLAPAGGRRPARFEDVRSAIRRVLVPVDLTPAATDLVLVARRVAETLDVPLLLAHVVEPMRVAVMGLPHLPNIDVERRARAEKALAEFVATIPDGLRPEGLVAYGDPAEEITKLARDRNAGLIVIALHASPLVGPRMGSVTYRVICTTSALVLAMPLEAVNRALGAPASSGPS